jgi:hypothetical protein
LWMELLRELSRRRVGFHNGLEVFGMYYRVSIQLVYQFTRWHLVIGEIGLVSRLLMGQQCNVKSMHSQVAKMADRRLGKG